MRSCVPTFRPKRTSHRVKIVGYSVSHSSHDTSRDGSVTVPLDTDLATQAEILWTNGVVETSRTLSGLRPGVYGAIVLSVKGQPVQCVHDCPVARVCVETSVGAPRGTPY